MTSEDSYNLQKNQDLHSEETKEICIRPSLEMDMTKEFSPRTVRYTSAQNSPRYPEFKISIPFTQTTSDILDLFQRCADKRGFEIIERNSSMATAVLREKWRLRDLIMCCLPVSEDRRMKGVISAVRLVISVNEVKCTRIALCKGIYGPIARANTLIQDFNTRIKLMQMNRVNGRQSKQYNRLESESEDDSYYISGKFESDSYYEFFKVLSSEQYSLGQRIQRQIESIMNEFPLDEESAQKLPQPLTIIKHLIGETVNTLFSHFNFGRSNSEKLMQHCRPAVEKYLFSKLGNHLLSLYKISYKEFDEEFEQKRQLIQKKSPQEIMRCLDIRHKYQLVGQDVPYQQAVDALDKLTMQTNPQDKINALHQVTNSMKTAVLDFWKGREELETMDDELPVLIYIFSLSQAQNLVSEIILLQDYTRDNDFFENEQRLLTNTDAAIRYISKEWKIN